MIPCNANSRHWRLWLGRSFLLALLLSVSATGSAEPPRTFLVGKWNVIAEVTPHPRVLALSCDGQTIPLLHGPAGKAGLRWLVWEKDGPRQIAQAFDMPGRWLSEDGWESQIPGLALAVTWNPEGDGLAVSCRLRNLDNQPRTVALWTIAALPREGWLLAPLSRGLHNGRWVTGKITYFWTTRPNEPCLQPGSRTLALDLARWPGQPSVKFGTRSNAAWAAAIRPDLQTALIVALPYAAEDSYPDDDCNITFWLGNTLDRIPYGEMEWQSPWKTLAPGDELTWTFSLTIPSLDLREPANADTLQDAIEQAHWSGTAPDSGWCLDARGGFREDRFGRVTAWRSDAGQVLARAPIWQNAPRRQKSGFVWNEDTLIEAEPETVPPWTAARRIWEMHLGSGDPIPAAGEILFQDGDVSDGLVAVREPGGVTVHFWSRSQPPRSLTVPSPAGTPLAFRMEWDSTARRLNILLGDGTESFAPFDGRDPTAPARLVIGRDARFPADWPRPAPHPFRGSLSRLFITNTN